MRIGGTRASYKKGCVGIVYATTSSPYIGGYRFDATDASSPWKAKYTSPTAPLVSGMDERSAAIAVAPTNQHIIYGGSGLTTLNIYGFDIVDGFGSANFKAADVARPNEFTDVEGICFSQDESKIVVSATNSLSCYDWDSGSSGTSVVGANLWSVATQRDGITSSSPQAIGSAVTLLPYNSLQFGEDEVVLQSEYFTSGLSNPEMHLRSLSTGSSLGFATYPKTNGQLRTPVAFSRQPSLVSGSTENTAMLVQDISSQQGYLVLALGLLDLTWASGRSSLIPSITAGNQRYCMFDPYGRLIIADRQNLRLYSQDLGTGAFSLIDSVTTWSHGTINSLAYDIDQDVLFVASQSAPYINAFRMSRSGFDLKYPAMTPSLNDAGSSVIRMSLVYDEEWKSYNA